MRKMAEIVRIDDVIKHPDAVALDICSIKGWKCVTKLGEFKIGELAIYCSIDSWMPHELFPHLSKGKEPREYEGIKGERLKTVKLRGQVSQGLILPLSVLDITRCEDDGYTILTSKYMTDIDDQVRGIFDLEGQDVTELLGIIKYDPPVPARLAGIARGNFPACCPRTDEERIQNLTKEWDVLRTYSYEMTEKIEGSSMTCLMIDGEFHVCSRNLDLKHTEDNSLWEIAVRYKIEENMRNLEMNNLAISGEIFGEGIQGNHYAIKGQDFMVYSIYDIVKGEYVAPDVRLSVCNTLGLKHVPVVASVYDFGRMTITNVLAVANGKSLINPEKIREGIVFKRIDGPEHFKAVSDLYLLGQK